MAPDTRLAIKDDRDVQKLTQDSLAFTLCIPEVTCVYFRTQHREARTPTVGALANASPLLRALKHRQLNPNESDSICASRRRSVSGAPLTIFGVANFGRPQLQHDTFDLAKLPSGSVIETAAAPQIKKTPSPAVESESPPRSTDNSAER